MFKLQEERDKLQLHSERKVLHSEEINLMQLQLSQKDAIIDDLKMRLTSKQGEVDRLRVRVDTLEKQRNTQEYVNFNFDANRQGTKNPYHGNPFAEFRKETKSDSQEQVKNAIDYYFKYNRESERMKMEYSDQALKLEAGFNQIRQDLEKVDSVVVDPPSYPFSTSKEADNYN